MATQVPARQLIAFPEVGVIRKGTPKIKRKQGDREFWALGTDLKNLFRVSFAPGTEGVRRVWHELHEAHYKQYGPQYATKDGYEVPQLNAMIPYKNAFDAWTWANETYDASGRLIARAVNGQYMTKRDPNTGELLIQNGEPFEAYKPGDAVTYKRGDKVMSLVLKPTGRLRLFLPEVKRFVNFTLKTSSFYDAIRIQENLGALQMVADMLNHGVAGGIPFFVYRVAEQISYTGKDGAAGKSEKWIVRLEADPEWVEAAVSRMGQFALSGEQVVGLLRPSSTVEQATASVPSYLQPTPDADETDAGDIPGDEPPDDFQDGEEVPQSTSVKPLPREAVDNTGNITAYRYDDSNVIKIVAGIWNIKIKGAAAAMHQAHAQKEIGDRLTVGEAIAFAKKKA